MIIEIIESQTDLYCDTLGFIDSVISDNTHSNIILMGDMNCNIYKSNNQFSILMNDFVKQQNLICTFDSMHSFNSDTSYTRCNLKQNYFSLLDYIFISPSLVPFISNVDVLDSGYILSDHIPVILSINVDIETTSYVPRPNQSMIDWRAIDAFTRTGYENVMNECLERITIPCVLHGNHVCNDSSHLLNIEKYYNDILNCLRISEQQLPRCKPTVKKSYWNDELSSLKNDSIVAHDYWRLNNCPRSGPIFEAKKHAYYKYKLFIRDCKTRKDQAHVDKLNEDLLSGDHDKFWRSFKYFNNSKSSQSARVGGLSNDTAIADCFALNFSSIFKSTNNEQSKKLRDKFKSLYDTYYSQHSGDSIHSLYLSWSEMLDVLSKLQSGKATASFLKAEHILYGSPQLSRHIHILFNAMIQHSYVPLEFLKGSITPLIKDSQGDHSSTDNYRALTLSVLLSNLFEHALLMKIGHLLVTDDLQFGYKKRHSVSHAIHTLKTTIDYFTSRGSNVFAAFLDCSKGFDKVNHNGIFIKLIQRTTLHS